jgi:hypothetical protein
MDGMQAGTSQCVGSNVAINNNSYVLRQARLPQSMNTLKFFLSSCTRKGATAELIALGMGTTEGICEEQNGQSQNETLNPLDMDEAY